MKVTKIRLQDDTECAPKKLRDEPVKFTKPINRGFREAQIAILPIVSLPIAAFAAPN